MSAAYDLPPASFLEHGVIVIHVTGLFTTRHACRGQEGEATLPAADSVAAPYLSNNNTVFVKNNNGQ